MTAAPVAISAAGRYGRREGSWIFERICSPSGLRRTVSGVIFPSVPGAPFGQSFIGVCCADAKPDAEQINSAVSKHRIVLAMRKMSSLFHERCKLTRPVDCLHPSKVESREECPRRG